ncbi:MAG: hypothetical protein AAF408_02150 [Pseudomonadota bacterium]
MPDLDSGHIFLTTLAPIRESANATLEHTSFTQNVRIALANLPTAMQSPATQKIGSNSPFSRNKRNHLARMFVLNDVVFNGREGKNALHASLTRDDPSRPKPVDRLNTSYLVFCADIDAVTTDGDPLPPTLDAAGQKRVRDAYARDLWTTMETELREIYCNCEGFDTVESAGEFAAYLDRCHVETTMPFHDYYLELPEFHHLPLKPLLLSVGVPAAIALLSLLLRIIGVMDLPGLGWSTFWTFVIALLLTIIMAICAIRYAIRNGEKPLAPGRYDDLPSVLKSLYIQQKFSDFVVAQQGSAPDELHAAFGDFLEQHKPEQVSGPTQEPGVISSLARPQP